MYLYVVSTQTLVLYTYKYIINENKLNLNKQNTLIINQLINYSINNNMNNLLRQVKSTDVNGCIHD